MNESRYWRKLLLTLAGAFLINFVPLPDLWGYPDQAWRPDAVLLCLLLWTLVLPRLVGLGIAMCCGLIMDIHLQTLLGQQALIYVVAVWCAQWLRIRMQFFSPWQQSLQLLPFFLLVSAGEVVLRLFFGHPYPGHSFFIPAFGHSLVWPFLVPLMRNWVGARSRTDLA